MPNSLQKLVRVCVALVFSLWPVTSAQGYAFNEIVPAVRQPAGVGSACPVASHQLSSPAAIAFRWSTILGTNPKTIVTQAQMSSGGLNEIEQVIQQSLSVWANVSGTSLTTGSFAPLTRVASANICGSDGINSICFDQPDMAFTPGVLAFTRVVTADQIGAQLGSGPPATQIGQILDADVYFNPSDPLVTFATPAALSPNPKAYDLESLLIHELGHALGFSHSAVRSATMFPFAPAPGTFTGMRPTPRQPDAPLADDDRTGLRVLYHDPIDTQFVGSIQGRISPANLLSVPASLPGVTEIFGAHIVAVDANTGSVMAGTLGGWSCQAPGPVQFDGSYSINALSVNHSYKVYAEPLSGALGSSQSNPPFSLCRNPTSDPDSRRPQACIVPSAELEFTAATFASP